MIALLLQIAGAISVGLALGLGSRKLRTVIRARVAANRQAKWDAHVAAAVRLSETPLYERVAQEYARNLDIEWKRASTSGWAAQ